MKKLLSAVLALAMVLSLAAVSFAEGGPPVFEYDFMGLSKDSNKAPLHYDADSYYSGSYGDHLMMHNGYISYGAAAYYPIYFKEEAGLLTIVSDSAFVEDMKIKAEWQEGGELIQDVSIVKMRVQNACDTRADYNNMVEATKAENIPGYTPEFVANAGDVDMLNGAIAAGGDYFYFVKLQIAPYFTAGEQDVIGTLTIDMKKQDEFDGYAYGIVDDNFSAPLALRNNNAVINRIDEAEHEVEFTVRLERHYTDELNKENSLIDTEEVYVEDGKGYAFKFDYDDEVEFSFGGSRDMDSNNEGAFTVDVSGQGKVIMMLSTAANEAIAHANPGVDMRFVSFNNVKVHRAGEFEYEMEDGVAAYKVVGNTLQPIPGCEYDEADECFRFRTQTLESYVFANAELVQPAA